MMAEKAFHSIYFYGKISLVAKTSTTQEAEAPQYMLIRKITRSKIKNIEKCFQENRTF